MTKSFLILHKVRGEPAFDIAENIGTDSDGDIWIIPTSGHRAYPYMTTALDQLYLDPQSVVERAYTYLDHSKRALMPENWPDHYSCNDKPVKHEPFSVSGLLQKLGLVKPPTVDRRI